MKEFAKCRESYFIRWLIILIGISGFLMVIVLIAPGMDFILPAYDTLHCKLRTVELKPSGFAYYKWKSTVNWEVLILRDFCELCYLYYSWMSLKRFRDIQNQFNIKNELIASALVYAIF